MDTHDSSVRHAESARLQILKETLRHSDNNTTRRRASLQRVACADDCNSAEKSFSRCSVSRANCRSGARASLSRDEDIRPPRSCIPMTNLMQWRAAKTAELAHRSRIGYQGIPNQQPKGDLL
jgi:hypothetical protein